MEDLKLKIIIFSIALPTAIFSAPYVETTILGFILYLLSMDYSIRIGWNLFSQLYSNIKNINFR